MNFKRVGIAVLAILLATAARADGRSAAHNFFMNLARAKSNIAVTEATTQVAPTLVRGMYVLIDQRNGQLVGYINEAGTIYGASRGFMAVDSPPRPLTVNEANDLRNEVMANIDYDKLIKVTYGDGGGRKVVLFSALDCPWCKVFEDMMRKNGSAVNTTLYVVPSSLQPLKAGGLPTWQNVARIWCAEDSGSAWLAYWSSHALPQPRTCRFDARTAAITSDGLSDILRGAGAQFHGTPSFVMEDGVVRGVQANSPPAKLSALLGPDGAPAKMEPKPARWLAANVNDSFQAQPVGVSMQPAPAATNNAQSATKVHVTDALLKKLLKQ